jgi:hypothetical protein
MTLTKSQFSVLIASGRCLETCLLKPFDGSPEIVFNVTAMRKMFERGRYKIKKYAITDAVIKAASYNREVDPIRVVELTENQWKNDPAILVVWETKINDENKTVFVQAEIIDGSHRIMRRSVEKLDFFIAYEVPIAKAITIDPNDPNFHHEQNLWGSNNFIEHRYNEIKKEEENIIKCQLSPNRE